VADIADVAIVGGGPIARALARALQDSALTVRRISDEGQGEDRPIALSHGTRLILERLDAWAGLPNTPISTIHVSQQGGFGRTLIRASELDLPALGYVSSYRNVLAALSAGQLSVAGRLEAWESGEECVRVRVRHADRESVVEARLLVIADGAGTVLRGDTKPYAQQALVSEVSTEVPHRGVAWERFADEGPIALLPFEERYALVWTAGPDTVQRMLRASDADFLSALRTAFGSRLGEFHSAGPRAAFPLALRRQNIHPARRVLLIGNAAQTLHPVAGQGLNLGMRDAWELAEQLLGASPQEFGQTHFAARYVAGRALDRDGGLAFTDGLVQLFSHSFPFASAARGLGLAALDLLPPARRFLARRMVFGARALP
jgi:2-octaprenyl-6-methoxyphenol hydroxylase